MRKIVSIIIRNKDGKFLSEGQWEVYPFLLEYIFGKIELNEESTEFKWVKKEDIKSFNILPRTLLDLEHLE